MSLESYGGARSGLLRFEVAGLGTRNTILLDGTDESAARSAAQDAFARLEILEAVLTKFRPDSDISLLNRLGAERPVRIGPEARFLLEVSREAWEITEGAFDPTIGPILKAWGFVDMEGRIPTQTELDGLLEARGMDLVGLDERGWAWLERPGVELDLGGVGKGFIVDSLAGRLRPAFARGAVISGRSSCVVWGAPEPKQDPGGASGGTGRGVACDPLEPWRFEVVHPDDPDEVVAELLCEAGAVSSSGASERRLILQGREHGHILDPRTGRPVHGVRGVTLWTEEALLGDILSTAIFVLGRPGLAEGGPVSRLLDAWRARGSSGRASVLLLAEDASVWGGLRVEAFHFGAPAFTM